MHYPDWTSVGSPEGLKKEACNGEEDESRGQGRLSRPTSKYYSVTCVAPCPLTRSHVLLVLLVVVVVVLLVVVLKKWLTCVVLLRLISST